VVPADLTIFAAKYLVFIAIVLGAVVVVIALYRRSPEEIVRWLVAAVIMLVVAGILALLGTHVYRDPRPFTQDHVKPLISHAPDNGFPSDHALLAAAIVGAVLLAAPVWAIPFAVLAILVDWARVGAGIHHVTDVVGSSVFVAIGLLVGWLLAPIITAWLVPRLPLTRRAEPAAEA
jgi:undecaprenyl-diphosphatase